MRLRYQLSKASNCAAKVQGPLAKIQKLEHPLSKMEETEELSFNIPSHPHLMLDEHGWETISMKLTNQRHLPPRTIWISSSTNATTWVNLSSKVATSLAAVSVFDYINQHSVLAPNHAIDKNMFSTKC